jgi:MFS family permease
VQIFLVALLATRLVEPPRETFDEEAGHKENVSRVWRHISGKPVLANFLLFFSVLGASSLTAVWMYQEFWRTLDVPLVWFGPLWAGINITVAFTARYAAAIRERVGRNRTLWILPCLPAAGFLGMSIVPGFAAIAFAGFIQMTRGFVSVLGSDEVNKLTGSEMRATINSISSGGVRVAFCTIGLSAGLFADSYGLTAAFLVCAVAFSVGGMLSLWRVRSAERSDARVHVASA